MRKKIHLLIAVSFGLFFITMSCKDDVLKEIHEEETPIITKAVPTPYFNWETADFMPTLPDKS